LLCPAVRRGYWRRGGCPFVVLVVSCRKTGQRRANARVVYFGVQR
jgi:hypothetical protein